MSNLANFPPGSLPEHLKLKPMNQAEGLWSILADCVFFSTSSGETFLAADRKAPAFLIPINHPECRQFLCQQFQRRFGFTPATGALRSAIARAHDSARAASLRGFVPALRVAALAPVMQFDYVSHSMEQDAPPEAAGHAKGSEPGAIAIHHGRSPTHWRITSEGAFVSTFQEGPALAPSFYSGRGSLPLPQPDPESPASALDKFFQLLRIPAGAARLRCLTWLFSAFRPAGPYPILILRGPSGSGKSFAARSLRALTDPNHTPLHPLPPSANQLRRLAYENWVLAFDHVTRFPRRTTESLARLTENEVHYLPPKRDPAAVSLARPILLTATDSCHIPPEIVARSLTVELFPMPDTERKTAAELQAELEALLPQVLARLLKALSAALSGSAGGLAAGHSSHNRTFPLPRLADAAAWVISAAPALGFTQPEIFQALSTPLDPLVERIAALMQSLELWRGSGAQLAAALNLDHDASQLSRQLFQNEAALNLLGFAITRSHGRLSRSIEIARFIVGPGFQPAAGLLPGANSPPSTPPEVIPNAEVTKPDQKLDENLENAVTPSDADDLDPPGSPGGLAASHPSMAATHPSTTDCCLLTPVSLAPLPAPPTLTPSRRGHRINPNSARVLMRRGERPPSKEKMNRARLHHNLPASAPGIACQCAIRRQKRGVAVLWRRYRQHAVFASGPNQRRQFQRPPCRLALQDGFARPSSGVPV